MRYIIGLFFAVLISFNFSFAQTASNTATTSLDICKTLNSIDLYTIPNLTIFQKYLQSFFPKLKVTGKNDYQNKFYIGKFQYAFGLKTTGHLNEDTLKFLRNQNNCFDLGKRVEQIENSKPIILISKEELMYQILMNNVYSTTTSTN